MSVVDLIRDKLTAALAPLELEVIDQSDQHIGHAGAREGGMSHFKVRIVAEMFAGKSRIARQRLVNAALRDELAGQIHALTMEVLAPGEADQQ